jgi:hypothetical protein
MFKVVLCVLIVSGLSLAAAHRSVVKVLCPDTTKVMKTDTLKTTKGDTTTIMIVNKLEPTGIVDTLVITTDTTKIPGKKVPVAPAKAAVVTPAAKPAVAPKK